jgi:hypothetical protein
MNNPGNISDIGNFCELQEDWVLATSSFDRPIRPDVALERLMNRRPLNETERLIQQLIKAHLARNTIAAKYYWALLLLRNSVHPWLTWQNAMRAFKKENHTAGLRLSKAAFIEAGKNLSLTRQINEMAPSVLMHDDLLLTPPMNSTRIAVVIPGDLRCIARNMALFQELLKYCDLFICTSERSRMTTKELKDLPDLKIRIVPDAVHLPFGAMQQWMRLKESLDMVEQAESQKKISYTHIVKLRTDYFYANPTELLTSVGKIVSGIEACSDKVFAGDRKTMMGMRAFYDSIMDYVVDKNYKFPVNIHQIIRSDDCFKWFGMLLPIKILNDVTQPDQFRTYLSNSDKTAISNMATEVSRFNQSPKSEKGKRLMQTLYDTVAAGEKVFASEICFAAFLNKMNITVRWNPSLSGILWSDRAS